MSYQRKTTTNGHRRPGKRYGVALVLIFSLMPIVFVFFYYRAAIADAAEAPYIAQVETIEAQPEVRPQSDEQPQQDGQSQSDVAYLATDPNVGTPPEQQSIDAAPDEPDEPDEPENETIGTAYLTFDDGPSQTITPEILDVLLEEGVNATFFTLPYSGVDDIFRRMINEGHEIGNHSHSHDYPTLYNGNVSAFREDILKAHRFVLENFGYTIETFRFPGGSTDTATGMSKSNIRNPRVNAINDIGYRFFDWDIDTNDWRPNRSAEEIINAVLDEASIRSVRRSDGRLHLIILMHDTRHRQATLEALPAMIEGLREMGYEFDILRNYPG